MRRTFVIRAEDKVGSFLRAAKIIGSCGGNIVRTSYNRSVDSNIMFLDIASDDEFAFSRISDRLGDIGFLRNDEESVMLISIRIPDVPNAIIPVLEVLTEYNVNISYMNAQDNGTPTQHFKMGIHIDDPAKTKKVLDRISELYEFTILDYEMTDKVLDNTVFYTTFASDMRNILSLDDEASREMMICSNKIMQILDNRGELPFKTFEYVKRFAQFVVDHGGDAFDPTYIREEIDNLVLHTVEPPCGSTIYVIESNDSLLFVDGGFPCYAEDTLEFISSKIEGFHSRQRTLFLTHPDLDHGGLAPYFSDIRVCGSAYDDFLAESKGHDRFRECNPNHAPYYRISVIITKYRPLGVKSMKIIGRRMSDDVYEQIGSIRVAGHEFFAYEGNGGHVRGDTILVCESLRLVFTGDDFINAGGSSRDQKEFNVLAPYLMQSVNMNSEKARQCRSFIESNFKGFIVCPGHGPQVRN